MCKGLEIAELLATGDPRLIDPEITREVDMHLMFQEPPDSPDIVMLTAEEFYEGLFVNDFPSFTPEEMLAFLLDCPPTQRRSLLGETLYPLVEALEQENTAKVTGMLLELPDSEIVRFIHSPDALREMVGKAMEILRDPQQGNSSANANNDPASSDNNPLS